MKRIILIAAAAIHTLYTSGQTVHLTDFTQNIVNEYLSQTAMTDHSGNMIIHFSTDSRHCFMSVFMDTIGYYDTAKADVIILNETELKISGVSIPFLITGKLNMKHLEISKKDETFLANFDPHIWKVVFHKDGTLCKMFTQKEHYSDSIDDIVNLSEQYLKGTSLKDYDKKYIYNNIEVDTPAEFQYDNNALISIMKSNMNIVKHAFLFGLKQPDPTELSRREKFAYAIRNLNSIPIVINLIIDESGIAKVDKFTKKTKFKDINHIALRIADTICGYNFTPAKHRGESVCVNYSLLFPKCVFE